MPFRTSRTELTHLTLAWLAISLAFAILFRWQGDFAFVFFASALTVGLGFIMHELAHKAVAQRYGSWSEFRMEPMMLFLAVLTAFAGFVFAAPGAVVIFNPFLTREENGKIAIAGPLANIALSFAFLSLAVASPFITTHGAHSAFSGVIFICSLGARISSWLAIFNLIPLGVLDGRKVLSWSKGAFTAAVALAISAFLASHFML